MNKHKGLAILAATAIIISACTTALPASNTNDDSSDDLANVNTNESTELEFTGVIEEIAESTITVNGQQISVSEDILATLGLLVGDTVKVEVETDDDGNVTAVKVEIISLGNDNTNDDNGNINDDSMNENENENENDNTNSSSSNSNTNANSNDDSWDDNGGDDDDDDGDDD